MTLALFSPRVRLWARQDNNDENRPKALALDATKGPGPGRVYDVRTSSVPEAKRLLALFLSPEPDEQTDGAGWLAWRQAKRDVCEVTS